MRRFSWFICLLFLIGPLGAEERLTPSAMRGAGIQSGSFQPIAFSHDDRWLAAFDRAPFEEKKEGTFYRLWFLEIERDGSIGEIKSVALDLKNLQQGEFSPDDSSFVVIGNRGTTFLRVQMDSMEVTPILQPEWGKAGFRADPAVLWTENDTLYVLGYPYDEARFVEPKTVAVLTAGDEFQTGPNLTALEKNVDRLWFTNYLSHRSAFFGQKYPQMSILSHWDGENVFEIDRAPVFLGFWGNGGRLLYSARRSDALTELLVYDVARGEKTLITSQEEPYRYLFLSRDGETALFSKAVPEGRLESYIARASEGWKVTPLVSDRQGEARSLGAGWMRISSSGNYVCHISETGLTLYPVP